MKNLSRVKELKEKLAKREEYKEGMDNELEFLRNKYRKQKKEKFLGTSFFKKRISVIFGLILITGIATGQTPDNPSSAINEFTYVMMFSFLLLIAYIDQTIFGWYLFKKQKKDSKRMRLIKWPKK